LFLAFGLPDRRIDPYCGWFVWRIGGHFDEALGIGGVGEIEDFLAGCVDCVGLAVVNLVRRHQSDACVMMIAIVPVDKASAEEFCVFDATEALRELRLVFQGFEAAFRERIVIRSVGPAV
jgi:hypothetical protein